MFAACRTNEETLQTTEQLMCTYLHTNRHSYAHKVANATYLVNPATLNLLFRIANFMSFILFRFSLFCVLFSFCFCFYSFLVVPILAHIMWSTWSKALNFALAAVAFVFSKQCKLVSNEI